jgi:protein TonB
MEQGWEGEFVIAVEILENGSVGRTYVMKSTGHKKLDEAATEAVTSWKFHPATRNAKPVVECVQIPVTFQLKSE